MSQKCLAFPPCSLGMVALWELSHHTVREPEQHMERPTWMGTKVLPMATAELSADSPSYQLTVCTNLPAMQGSHLEMDFPAPHQTVLMDPTWKSDEMSPLSPAQTEDCEQNN